VDYTGIPEEKQHGDGWTEAVHPEDRERIFERWRASLEGRAQYDVEYRLRRHDGAYRWFGTRAQAIRDDRGVIIRWFGTSTDIEEQKQAKREILEARNAAEAANRAKDHFLAILSHELRTPLMPVLAAVQRLESEPDMRPDLRERVAMIRRNVTLETRLIDDLLDHTRIGRGKLELRPARVDVHETIRQTLAICEEETRDRHLLLTLDLQARRPWVRADPARLQQVFWNLLKNAIKFTPQGGTIAVRTSDEGGDLAVEVRDTGIGIAPEDLSRIFDSFEQGSRDQARRFGGLGLGLAISKGLVELHGGTLVAESGGVGQGAVFTARFPALEMPITAALEAAPAERRPGGQRVLIVDDHHDTLLAMADLLEMMGYAVGTADSVAAALRTVEGGRFDVVISDIGLPDGSGLDLMRQLHARTSVRGIALSGFGMEEDQRRSLEAGFSEHLTKPIDLQQLEQALLRVTAG
jgi:PAS domain S-box-containing protein